MPGVYGLAAADRPVDLEELLQKMAAQLKHHDWYVEERHLDPSTGLALGRTSLGLVQKAGQPALNEDRSRLAFLEGELYDYDEQRRSLTALGCRFTGDSHAELLLHGYERKGQEFLRSLHGFFVAVLWDAQAGRLTVTNDRFGMKPLYYTRRPGRFLFASELKALLTDPQVARQPNRRGIAQFFAFAQLLGDETLLEGIHYLPPAAVLTYDVRSDRVRLERYWRLESGPGGPAARPADLLDSLDDAFKRSVARCTAGAGRLGLSLSGGLDARTILAAVDLARVPLTTVTLGIEGSIDFRSAHQLAALAGCPHHNYVLDARFLADYAVYMRRLVHLTDGHYQSQCVTMPTLPLYRELGIDVLLRGHAGELLHMTKAYNFSLDAAALDLRDEAALEDWLLRRLHAFVAADEGSLFAGPEADAMEELARQSLRDCLRESAHLQPLAHRIWHLFLTQRLRRETALSLVEFGSVVQTRLPYLDNELIDLLFAAPPELKLDETIQAHILARRMPAALGVINVNTGTRLGANRLERLMGKARLKVFAKLGVKGYQPYERLGRWLREDLRPLVLDLVVSDRTLGRGLFNPEALRSIAANHLNGRRNHTFLLLALMIFELGQRKLVDGGSGEG